MHNINIDTSKGTQTEHGRSTAFSYNMQIIKISITNHEKSGHEKNSFIIKHAV